MVGRWSQVDLAKCINVSRQTIVSLENGRYEPTLKTAMRLSAVFDAPIEEIFSPDPDNLSLGRTD